MEPTNELPGAATEAMRAGALPAGHLVDSVDELLAGAERREAFEPDERRSGTAFERVWIDGEPHVVKYLHLDDDFTMRVSGDLGCRPLQAYARGVMEVAPDLIDHAVVAAATGHGRNGWGAALLMRDVSAELVPTDRPLTPDQHARFLDHLAGMCARTWGWPDDDGLLPYATRWSWFGAAMVDQERRLGWPEVVPQLAEQGWQRFASAGPADVAAGVEALRHDIDPLVAALRGTPSCLLHGDWKAANLGAAPDGRTVLIDWAYVGPGPAVHELGWYLALNRALLPTGEHKEDAIAEMGSALARHGVDLDGWWPRQVALGLLGTVVQFGWEKAFGADDPEGAAELAWWCDRARDGLRLL